jgi:hypothetical protein
VQYDNLNVVESLGRNSRIAFPYRSIEKLRGAPASARVAAGVLTYVYHLFPNVMVATFPSLVLLVVLEPLAVDRTRILTYVLTDGPVVRPAGDAASERSRTFLLAGTGEDNAMAHAVQRGLASGANACFEFGRFEGAIGRFHRALHAALAEEG